MNLSYREKSIWGSLIAILVVFGYYFATLAAPANGSQFDAANVGRLVLAVIAIVVIEIVYHILISVRSKPEPKDERDIRIEGKSYRNAYFLLASGAFLSPFAATPFAIANMILLSMAIAEIGGFLTQLFYYRRGL